MVRTFSLALLAVLLSSALALAQFRTVTVQNANNNPVPTTIQNTPTVNVSGTVPVSGTVGISGTPSVNATITGTPSVSVTGTPTVSVTNLPTGTAGPSSTTGVLVKSLDNPGLQPFQKTIQCVITVTPNSSTCPATYTVPAGKELVIEYLMGVAGYNGALGQVAYELDTTVAGNAASYFYPPIPNWFVPNSEHLVRIYADPSSTVVFTGFVIGPVGSPGSATFTMTLSGHLVNVP